MRVLLAGGIVSAVLAALVADDVGLSLGFGAVAAAFLTFAGLAALALRMPALPPLVLPATSVWQLRVRQALAGDGLSRLQLLDAVEAASSWKTGTSASRILDQRDHLLALPRREFDRLLRNEIARVESEG